MLVELECLAQPARLVQREQSSQVVMITPNHNGELSQMSACHGMSLLLHDIAIEKDTLIVFIQEPYLNPESGAIQSLSPGLN